MCCLGANNMRIIRLNFEKKKNDFLFFFLCKFYGLNDITVSHFSECGVMI